MKRPARATALPLAALALLPAACTPCKPLPPNAIDTTRPLPALDDVRDRYNARVAPLDCVRGNADIAIFSRDEDGKETKEEQAEGFLTYVAPRGVALRINRLSQTYFWLGSNNTQYWWFDLAHDERFALLGTHEKASPAVASRFNLPVHPLDLLDLMALSPLPDQGQLAWSQDPPALRLTLPPRAQGWGARVLYLNPDSLEPFRVELLDAADHPAVVGELSRFTPVEVDGQPFSPARLPARLRLVMPQLGATASLQLNSLANPGAQTIRPAVFDFASLARAHRIDKTFDLDAPAEEPAR